MKISELICELQKKEQLHPDAEVSAVVVEIPDGKIMFISWSGMEPKQTKGLINMFRSTL